jgi:hypothetical protein
VILFAFPKSMNVFLPVVDTALFNVGLSNRFIIIQKRKLFKLLSGLHV